MQLNKTVVLIGLMGVGKSSIGRRLAEFFDVPFRDSDHLIEERQGVSVTEIFKYIGDAGFRELEYNTIKDDLSDGTPHVLATGGGAFMQETTREMILSTPNVLVVWLRAELNVLVERVSRKNNRPLLEGVDKREMMAKLMNERYPIYELAHCVVESDEAPHAEVLTRVIETVKEHQ